MNRSPGATAIGRTAEEIDGWKTALEGRGIGVEADFEWPPFGKGSGGGRSIYFRDPSGNSIEFAEPRIWGL